MAPVAPSNTPRFWLDYNDGANDHSQMWRCADESQFAALMVIVDGFWTDLTSSLYEITVLGARVADQGSDVSNPIAWTGASTYGSGAITPVSRPVELRFEGRDTLGRRVSWSVYGWKGGVAGNFRFSLGEFASLDNAVAALNGGVDDGIVVTIQGQLPIIKNYINIQNNSYWETKARG